MNTTTFYTSSGALSIAAADISIWDRECTARRLLSMLQSWARDRLVDTARGAVFIARSTWESMLGVTRWTLRRAIDRLRRMGWLVDARVADDFGQERDGFIVAVSATGGWLHRDVDVHPTCTQLAPDLHPTCTIPSFTEENEIQVQDKTVRSQMLMPGLGDQPGLRDEGADEHDRRRQQLADDIRAAAQRVMRYERERYAAHPRCKRRKLETPTSQRISSDAISRVLRALVESDGHDTLEEQETRLRAVVELRWERALDREQDWAYWTGTRIWEGRSIGLALEWLDEPHNADCLRIARGELEPPTVERRKPGAKGTGCLLERMRRDGHEFTRDVLTQVVRNQLWALERDDLEVRRTLHEGPIADAIREWLGRHGASATDEELRAAAVFIVAHWRGHRLWLESDGKDKERR